MLVGDSLEVVEIIEKEIEIEIGTETKTEKINQKIIKHKHNNLVTKTKNQLSKKIETGIKMENQVRKENFKKIDLSIRIKKII